MQDNTPAGPIQELAEDDQDGGKYAVYNQTLLRFEGHGGITAHDTRAAADKAAKELRNGRRKGHKLVVQSV